MVENLKKEHENVVTQLKVNKYLKQKFENQKNLKANISNALLTPMKESCLKPVRLISGSTSGLTSGLSSNKISHWYREHPET